MTAPTRARQLVLSTTNDDLRALDFYQRRGFPLAELPAGAVDRARGPEPPGSLLRAPGTPIRDELVLVRGVGPGEEA